MKVKAGGGYGAYLRHAIGQACRTDISFAPQRRTRPGSTIAVSTVRLCVPPSFTLSQRRKSNGRSLPASGTRLTAAAFDVQVVTVDAGWLK